MAIDIERAPDSANGEKWAPDALYDIGFQKWKQQQADIEGLDRKAFSLFAVSSGVLVAGTAVLRLQERVPLVPHFITAMALGAFVIAAIAIFRATRIATFAMGPDPDLTIPYGDRYNDRELKHWAGRSFLISYQTNKPLLNDKASRIAGAQIAVAIETALIVLALLLSFTVTP